MAHNAFRLTCTDNLKRIPLAISYIINKRNVKVIDYEDEIRTFINPSLLPID